MLSLITGKHLYLCQPTGQLQRNFILHFSYSHFSWHKLEVNLISKINYSFKNLQPQIASLKTSTRFKDHSARILKCWSEQLEFITAHRIRRIFQITSLYNKWWGNLNELFGYQRIIGDISRKTICFTACLAPFFDWDKNRIQPKEFSNLINDLFTIKRSAKEVSSRVNGYPLPLPEPLDNPFDQEPVFCGCVRCRHVTDNNWTILYEGCDMKIWRREHLDHLGEGLYVYKVYGYFKDITADDFFRVQIDTSYRKEWDTNSIKLDVVDSDTKSKSDILYWEFLFPAMFYNRDYVCNRRYEINEEKQFMAVVSENVEHPACPERPPIHRVKEYWSHIIIRPTNGNFYEPGMEFTVTYFDNPELSIPSYVSIWYSVNGMPDYLNKQRAAALTLAKRREAKSKPNDIFLLNMNKEVAENKVKEVQEHPHKRVLLL